MTPPLASRIALVTGASRGIGYATARALAKAGAHIVAVARTQGGLEELDDEIRKDGGSATLVPLNLIDYDGIARLGAALHERHGKLDILVGNALPLRNIPPGTTVHNIELKPGKGAQMVRSAGGSAQLVAKEGDYALIKLPSGETRKVLVACMATIGQVSNLDHENISIGKAGRTRWLGIRPTNRGVVMNPVDHPHGGGEGKTSGGRHPVTPWGQPTRGYKTRNNKRTDKFIVARRTK